MTGRRISLRSWSRCSRLAEAEVLLVAALRELPGSYRITAHTRVCGRVWASNCPRSRNTRFRASCSRVTTCELSDSRRTVDSEARHGGALFHYY